MSEHTKTKKVSDQVQVLEVIHPADEMIERQPGREILSVPLTNSERVERGEGIARNLGGNG